MAKLTTVRVLLALTDSKEWKLCQMNVKNVILHRESNREIYIDQPKGFEKKNSSRIYMQVEKGVL